MTTIAPQEQQTDALRTAATTQFGYLIPYKISPALDPLQQDPGVNCKLTNLDALDQKQDLILLYRDELGESLLRLQQMGYELTLLDPPPEEVTGPYPDVIRGNEAYGGRGSVHQLQVFRLLGLTAFDEEEFGDDWSDLPECEGYAWGFDVEGIMRIALINDVGGEGRKRIEEYVENAPHISVERMGEIKITDFGDLCAKDVEAILHAVDPAWQYKLGRFSNDVFWGKL